MINQKSPNKVPLLFCTALTMLAISCSQINADQLDVKTKQLTTNLNTYKKKLTLLAQKLAEIKTTLAAQEKNHPEPERIVPLEEKEEEEEEEEAIEEITEPLNKNEIPKEDLDAAAQKMTDQEQEEADQLIAADERLKK